MYSEGIIVKQNPLILDIYGIKLIICIQYMTNDLFIFFWIFLNVFLLF